MTRCPRCGAEVKRLPARSAAAHGGGLRPRHDHPPRHAARIDYAAAERPLTPWEVVGAGLAAIGIIYAVAALLGVL